MRLEERTASASSASDQYKETQKMHNGTTRHAWIQITHGSPVQL